MLALSVFKVVSLFMAIWWSTVNVGLVKRNESVPWLNFVFMSAGITFFMTIHFKLWEV